jgi:hypothetical protein
MDIRFAAFELIARDSGLRALLVNYADHVEHDRNQDGPAPDACFVALQWTGDDRACAASGPQLLTARVHMPARRCREHLFLDLVVQRLRSALAADRPDRLIAARCLGTSGELVDSAAETVFKTCTFEITPAVPRHTGAGLRRLVPWPGGVDCGGGMSVTTGDAVASLN